MKILLGRWDLNPHFQQPVTNIHVISVARYFPLLLCRWESNPLSTFVPTVSAWYLNHPVPTQYLYSR